MPASNKKEKLEIHAIMKHEFFDHHRQGSSLVHHMDPRLKLGIMGVFILVVVLVPYHLASFFVFYAAIPLVLEFLSRGSMW